MLAFGSFIPLTTFLAHIYFNFQINHPIGSIAHELQIMSTFWIIKICCWRLIETIEHFFLNIMYATSS
jgi:hypothetical protein